MKPSERINQILNQPKLTTEQTYMLRRDMEIAAIIQYLDEEWYRSNSQPAFCKCGELLTPKDGGYVCEKCNG